MQHVVITDLANSTQNLPPGPWRAASIAPGSILDTVEIDGRVLGVGGLVACGPGSVVTAKQRGRLSDAQNSYVSLLETPNGGLPRISQVADRVELCLWDQYDPSWTPATKRAPMSVSAFVPIDDIPNGPFNSGVGYRVHRMPCPGRDKAFIWLSTPNLEPLGAISVLWRLRVYGDSAFSENFSGTHAVWEGPGPIVVDETSGVVVAPATSVISPETGAREPIVVDLRGAFEIEVYIAGVGAAVEDGWGVRLEVRD